VGEIATNPESTTQATTPDPVRIQILATEHWSLLAQRSMIWNELFSRAAMFITVLSASTVALALVAQATDFDQEFHLFALLVLPVTLVLGIGTLIRLADVITEDVWLLMGMNRLRHGYMDTAPDLEPYFITSQYDDFEGILQTRGPHPMSGLAKVLSATPTIVAIVDAAVAGVIVGLLASYLGASEVVENTIGAIAAVIAGALLISFVPTREINRFRDSLEPRFPTPADDRGEFASGRGTAVPRSGWDVA
jgi:hypothetical protein